MSKLRIDLRRVLRGIGRAAQAEQAERLLSSASVKGGSLAPAAEHGHAPSVGRRARLRLYGVRIALADITGRLGIRTGAMLRDLTKASNLKVTRTGFKIVPSPEMFLRWNVFNKGDKHQPARQVGGMTGATLDAAGDEIAEEARNQFVASFQDGNS